MEKSTVLLGGYGWIEEIPRHLLNVLQYFNSTATNMTSRF